MKRFAVFLFACFSAFTLIGAQETRTSLSFYQDAEAQTKAIIDASRALEAKGQFSKAWNLLATFDPDNKNGYVLAEKIRLALDGNVSEAMMVSFGFVDLAEGQSLAEVRANPPEKQNMVNFNPLDLVDALEKSGAAVPPVLSLELANYLYIVAKDYGDNWLVDNQTVMQKAVEHFDRALAYDTYTEASLTKHVELLINLQQYEGAEKVLNKAIALYPNNQNFSVSLAYSLNDQGKSSEVYPIVDKIIANPETSESTYNAYIEGIKAGLNEGDSGKTDSYIDAMIERFPDEYVPMLIQHLVAVNTGNTEKANTSADSVTENSMSTPMLSTLFCLHGCMPQIRPRVSIISIVLLKSTRETTRRWEPCFSIGRLCMRKPQCPQMTWRLR